MNTKQLNNVLKQDIFSRKNYGIILAINEIPPRIIYFPTWLIINSETSYEPGGHWVSIYFKNEKNPADFFDSFGKEAQTYSDKITKLLFTHHSTFQSIANPIQLKNSNTCGLFVLYFIIHKMRGKSFKKIIKDFSSIDLKKNEKIVHDFIFTNYEL
jgi:hypothetical protein